jgi:hypothetical protein
MRGSRPPIDQALSAVLTLHDQVGNWLTADAKIRRTTFGMSECQAAEHGRHAPRRALRGNSRCQALSRCRGS